MAGAAMAMPAITYAQDDNAAAQQQEEDPGLFPAQGIVEVDPQISMREETHPPLRLTPERSEILNFDESIGRIIIGNDINLNILMDTDTRIIVVPRAPGATHFTIMGENGKIIMQRHAIIASPKQKYIRIRENCSFSDGCMPVRMFYCPGMCHEVAVIGEDGTSFSGSLASEGGGGGGGNLQDEMSGDLGDMNGGGGLGGDDDDDNVPEGQ